MNFRDMNIHAIFNSILNREDKQKNLSQTGMVIWLTGLSGSGKSTIANALERRLAAEGYVTMLLDGDNVRAGINSDLGFEEQDRVENIRRVAEISKLFLNCGIITLASFVSPTENLRALAKTIVGEANFLEVFINTPLEVCEKRDVKGIYKKARAGKIPNFTGIHAPFEAPANPAIELHTENQSIEDSVNELYSFLKPKIELN